MSRAVGITYLLSAHLERKGSPCEVGTTPGVIPKRRGAINMLSPGIAISCEPAGRSHAMPNPVVLIEILSPSNHAETRANVRAFTSIPSLMEIVIVHGSRIAAEVLRRRADGTWPDQPDFLGPDDALRLNSVDFSAPLADAYRTAGL
jgi:Uma2 family endonuclease